MSSTLINSQDKYYEYGDEGLEKNGLAIRGYESAFLADLVASYLLEVTNNQFKEVLWRGIYRDDRLLVFKGKNHYQISKYGEINSKRKLMKLQETITYNSLVRLGTQLDAHKETKTKPL